MRLGADHDVDRWSAEEAVILDVPARTLEKRMPGRCERDKVGHGGPGDDCAAAALWKAEHLAHPVESYLLERNRNRRLHLKGGVLVPGAHQPRSGEGRGKAAAIHKAKIAAAAVRHGRGRSEAGEQVEDDFGTGRILGQRSAQFLECGDCFRGRSDRPIVDAIEIVRSATRRTLQSSDASGHDTLASGGRLSPNLHGLSLAPAERRGCGAGYPVLFGVRSGDLPEFGNDALELIDDADLSF